jgi:hypothetical protein
MASADFGECRECGRWLHRDARCDDDPGLCGRCREAEMAEAADEARGLVEVLIGSGRGLVALAALRAAALGA